MPHESQEERGADHREDAGDHVRHEMEGLRARRQYCMTANEPPETSAPATLPTLPSTFRLPSSRRSPSARTDEHGDERKLVAGHLGERALIESADGCERHDRRADGSPGDRARCSRSDSDRRLERPEPESDHDGARDRDRRAEP
jgi:hypothetical protein